MLKVRIDGKTYELPSVNDALASLTGDESLLIEEYLGGFEQLGLKMTKSAVVMVWLTLRQAGAGMTLDEIQAIPGLAFGGVIEDDGLGEPEDPMQDPGRPLAETNASNGSLGGSDVSAGTRAISASSGRRA